VKKVVIKGKTGDSSVYIGETLKNLRDYLPAGKVLIITDANVWDRHRDALPRVETIRLGMGEGIKTLDTAASLYARLVELNADRSTFLVGIGGGIVCDITGFVASTYMRGIPFGYVATSLLAQVDASVGGKNGVNFGGYKNMVGVFNQPEFVICDLSLLSTLPAKEIACGFAEIIKHAAIADPKLFSDLERKSAEARSLDRKVLEHIVYESVRIKAAVVSKDEKEKGERRKLNFGHTFGHAIEKTCRLSHGEAVSLGMVLASAISVREGLLPEAAHLRLKALLESYRLPIQVVIRKEAMWDALQKDKKRETDRMHFVLLEGIGRAVVHSVPLQSVKAYLEGVTDGHTHENTSV
jgi:3-dehydroquinate synthase